jgi:hypothetical protein
MLAALAGFAVPLAMKYGTQYATSLANSTIDKTLTVSGEQASAGLFRGILEDDELWKTFGQGNESSRKHLKMVTSTKSDPKSVISEITPYLHENATTFAATIAKISGETPDEAVEGILTAQFKSYKSKVHVAPNRLFSELEADVKKDEDGRDLTHCVYVGRASAGMPPEKIASF